MERNEFDELLDSLPLHLRNKVLAHGQEPSEPTGRRVKKPNTFVFAVLAMCLFIWAVPWTVLGLLICIPIITVPFGVAIMAFGCLPLSLFWTNHVRRRFEYQQSVGGTSGVRP